MTDLESSIARSLSIAKIKFDDAKYALKVDGYADRKIVSDLETRESIVRISGRIREIGESFSQLFSTAMTAMTATSKSVIALNVAATEKKKD